MLWSVIRTGSAAVQRRATAPNHPPALPVPIRVLGQSMAPVIPQQVGNWWLEPLGPATILPARAQRRLQAVLAAGVVPRAVVVFHELPPTPPVRFSAARRHAVSVAQSLPSLAAAVERSALRPLPLLGWLLIAAVRTVLLSLAAGLRRWCWLIPAWW